MPTNPPDSPNSPDSSEGFEEYYEDEPISKIPRFGSPYSPNVERVEESVDEPLEELTEEEAAAEGFDDEDEDDTPLTIDPALIYIVLVVAILIGLNGFPVDARFMLVWSALALVAVLAIIVDNIELSRPRLRDFVFGVGYGGAIAFSLLVVGAPQLRRVSLDIFGAENHAAIFQMLAFTMPFAETLFFRGALQATRGMLFTSLAAGFWTVILFFPYLNVLQYPPVAFVFGIAFIFVSFLYSYLRGKVSLYAAWSCQITINLVLLFLPRMLG
jgi:hypothetical protein